MKFQFSFGGQSRLGILFIVAVMMLCVSVSGLFYLGSISHSLLNYVIGVDNSASELDAASEPKLRLDNSGLSDHGESGSQESITEVVLVNIAPTSVFTLSVRRLLRVQSNAAAGIDDKELTQRGAMRMVEDALRHVDPAIATNAELESLAVYVLSGGDPRKLSGFIERLSPSSSYRRVLLGAQRYVLADSKSAREQFADLQPDNFSASLSARLSLVRASLVEKTDVQAQSDALVFAVSVSPGSLVEEAALRRLVALAADRRDRASFLHWTLRYVRRFPRSYYVQDFEEAFTKGILALEKSKIPVDRKYLDVVLESLPSAPVNRILLQLGQKSTDMGLSSLCSHISSSRFLHLITDPINSRRLKLYGLACAAVTEPERTLKALDNLDQDGLGDYDITLIRNVKSLAEGILASEPTQLSLTSDEFVTPGKGDPFQVSVTQQLESTNSVLREALK